MIFFTVMLRPFIKYHSPPCFPSRNITKNADTHSPPMRDVIIEQPLSIYVIEEVVLWCSVKKGTLENFVKFTGKRLCQSLFLNKVAGLRPPAALVLAEVLLLIEMHWLFIWIIRKHFPFYKMVI